MAASPLQFANSIRSFRRGDGAVHAPEGAPPNQMRPFRILEQPSGPGTYNKHLQQSWSWWGRGILIYGADGILSPMLWSTRLRYQRRLEMRHICSDRVSHQQHQVLWATEGEPTMRGGEGTL